MTYTLTTENRHEMAREEMKTLRRAHRRFTRWLAACDKASKGDLTEWSRLTCPSKAFKHRMYGSVGRIHQLLELDGERARTMEEISELIARASQVLAR